MKNSFISMVVLLALVFCSCQKDEITTDLDGELTLSDLAAEYGFSYRKTDENVAADYIMDINELKAFLEGFKKIEGKVLKAKVREVTPPTKGWARPLESGVYLLDDIIPSLGILIEIKYFQMKKYFDLLISDALTGPVKHRSYNNTNIYFNYYDNTPWISLVKEDITIQILSNGNLIDFKMKLQVDWNYINDPTSANFNISTQL